MKRSVGPLPCPKLTLMSCVAAVAVGMRIPATPTATSQDGHGGWNCVSRFSWWTAEQTGHLLFEIFVEVFAGCCGRLARFGLRLELGFGSRLEFLFRLRLKFRIDPGFMIAQRRACACVIPFDRCAGQMPCEGVGNRCSAFRRGRTTERGLELLRHFSKVVIGLRRRRVAHRCG